MGLYIDGRRILGEIFWSGGDFVFHPGGDADSSILGKGATDTDITYWRLQNADGEACYIYPNATQDAIVVSNTKP